MHQLTNKTYYQLSLFADFVSKKVNDMKISSTKNIY